MLKSQFWHVCYLKPKSEKIVQRKIEELGIEVFLPLAKHLKIYKTAKKSMSIPLFPGYIFVNIAPGYRHNVTAIPEVYRFIKFKDEYAKVSEEEIMNLHLLLTNINDYSLLQRELTFQKGKKVKVTSGPFNGMTGKMTCKNGARRIIIEIDVIKQSVSVEIDIKHLCVMEDFGLVNAVMF